MSHLAWTEALPEGWAAKPLRSIADYMVSNVDKVNTDTEIPVQLCNYTDVYNNEFIRPGLGFMRATASEKEITRFCLLVDDVIITKDSESWNDIGVPALVVETSNDLVCGYHLALLRPCKQVIYGAFLFRCLQAKPIQVQLELAANGVTRFGLPKSEIGTAILPVPPLPKQRAIADYLDRETARLDALVAAKERSITLLKERRDALVSAVVTGQIDVEQAVGSEDRTAAATGDGVTPHASRHRVRLKYCAHIEMGQSPPSTDYSSSPEGGLPFLQGTADFGTASPTPHVYCGSPTKLASAGDILFSVRAPVGEINLADQEFGIGRGLCAIRPQQHWNARFAWWALHEARHQLNFVSTGSTYEAVATEDVGNLSVETTTLGAQRANAEYLDRETARLDSLLAAKERSIVLLKERRAALISAAVTGQINVEQVA